MPTASSFAQEPSPTALVEGNTAFALNLYAALAPTKGNTFFSPYSISLALAMTYSGARGNTAKEMQEALHFPPDQTQLPAAFKTLTVALTSAAKKDAQDLNIANGLCLTHGSVNPGFKSLLKTQYDAEIFPGNLTSINAWVNQRTNGKIPKILDHLDPQSVCVILNAVYFKGIWKNQFGKSDTHDGDFKVSNTDKVTIPFMYQKKAFQLLQEKDFQAVSIPYFGNDLSMVILLPKEVDGLPALEKRLSKTMLQQWLANLDKTRAREIALTIPKYSLSTKYDLLSPCKEMGIKEAFVPGKADFSGIGAKLYISQIEHAAFVEVSEQGTEAAAATGGAMAAAAIIMPPVFIADHPFLFMIRDNQNKTILFMGRLVDPKST